MNRREARKIALAHAADLLIQGDEVPFYTAEFSPGEAEKIANEVQRIGQQLHRQLKRLEANDADFGAAQRRLENSRRVDDRQ